MNFAPEQLEYYLRLIKKQELTKNIRGECLQMHFDEYLDIDGDKAHRTLLSVAFDGIPSQCGCAILYSWCVTGLWQERMKEFYDEANKILEALNYSKVMVTLNDAQYAIKDKLISFGFKVVDEFKNKRSGRNNFILTKDI